MTITKPKLTLGASWATAQGAELKTKIETLLADWTFFVIIKKKGLTICFILY